MADAPKRDPIKELLENPYVDKENNLIIKILRRKHEQRLRKGLPIHDACITGNKKELKKIISTLPKRALDIKDYFGRTPLILTVMFKHVSCCEMLLKAGATVDKTDNAGQTALHIVASKGYHSFVKLLLSYRASCIQIDYSGATPLHMAAISPDKKVLPLVMKHAGPAEIDFQDSYMRTPLHWSAAYIRDHNIKMLLDKGANACIPDYTGKTPLHWAAANKEREALDCVKTLLKRKPSLINWQDYQGRSPLHMAVGCGCEEVVHCLMSMNSIIEVGNRHEGYKQPCDVDILDNYRLTPLHYAAKHDFSEKADILLTKRASHLGFDNNEATPLHYAAHNDCDKTVKVFTNKAFVTDVPDKFGRTAALWAAVKNSIPSLLHLVSIPGNLNRAGENGYTALHAAAIYGRHTAIEILLKAGASVDPKDKNGMTPFLKACQYGRSKSALMLLDHGANMNETDVDSCSALHWCARGSGSAYITQVLINRGADPNIRDNYGRTPLHYASYLDDFYTCTYVLREFGGDPNATDMEGKTPLHEAVLNERINMVKYLVKRDSDANAMFLLENEWVTPYDCAMYKCNVEIADFFENEGGLQAQYIREYAALLIQSWYKRKRRTKSLKPHADSSSKSYVNSSLKLYVSSSVGPKSSDISCIWSSVMKHHNALSSCQIISVSDLGKKDFIYICEGCFYKYARQCMNQNNLTVNIPPAVCYKATSVPIPACLCVPEYKLLAICKNPATCSGLIYLNSVHFRKIFFHEVLMEQPAAKKSSNLMTDTAARVIQKAWKRYVLRRSFTRIRNKVQLSYLHDERSADEEILHLKLEDFLKKVLE